MGDRYFFDRPCPKCGRNIECYYAPSCEMTKAVCFGCGTTFEIYPSFDLIELSAASESAGKINGGK